MKTKNKLKILLKEQEKRLSKNEIKFKAVFDQATVGIAFVDLQSANFIEVNKKYCTILDCTPKEIENNNFLYLTHPDDRAECLKSMQKC